MDSSISTAGIPPPSRPFPLPFTLGAFCSLCVTQRAALLRLLPLPLVHEEVRRFDVQQSLNSNTNGELAVDSSVA